jgi:hypothetical protein
MMATPSTATYYGYYTENNLSFKSTSRFAYSYTGVPSDANAASGQAYTGITPIGSVHTVSYKRTNIAAGMYQLDIPLLDDNGYLFINGVMVFKFIGCCQSHTNVWTGYIDPSTTVEFRWVNLAIHSQGALTLTPIKPVTYAASQITTNSFSANWNPIATTNPINYSLDVASDSNFTGAIYSNLNVGNVTSYTVSNLTPGNTYYYRVKASFANGVSGNSNTTQVKIKDDISLPISFVEFKANKKEDGVELTWETATEINNSHFTVEKSSDAVTFSSIATVKGAGNSNTVRSYAVTDAELKNGMSYYRIKQTDFDGKSTYSVVICFNYTPSTGLTVCPNPSNSGEVMRVSIPDNGQNALIVVRDMQGQEYYSKVILDTENHQLVAVNPEPALAPGMYMVIASSDNSIYSQKIIVR